MIHKNQEKLTFEWITSSPPVDWPVLDRWATNRRPDPILTSPSCEDVHPYHSTVCKDRNHRTQYNDIVFPHEPCSYCTCRQTCPDPGCVVRTASTSY